MARRAKQPSPRTRIDGLVPDKTTCPYRFASPARPVQTGLAIGHMRFAYANVMKQPWAVGPGAVAIVAGIARAGLGHARIAAEWLDMSSKHARNLGQPDPRQGWRRRVLIHLGPARPIPACSNITCPGRNGY